MMNLDPREDRSVPRDATFPNTNAPYGPVGRALCSGEVQAAFVHTLAPGLKRRFSDSFADVGMYPIPVLTRDTPGYRITPHTDTRWKGITVQLYLPRDDKASGHRHDLPQSPARRFAAESDADAVRAQYSGYAFAVVTTPCIWPIRWVNESRRATASC